MLEKNWIHPGMFFMDSLQWSKYNALEVNMYVFLPKKHRSPFFIDFVSQNLIFVATFHGSSILVYSSYNLWIWSLGKGCSFHELRWSLPISNYLGTFVSSIMTFQNSHIYHCNINTTIRVLKPTLSIHHTWFFIAFLVIS